MIRNGGPEPEVIEYLKPPPTREQLRALVTALAIPVRELLRSKEARYKELGLDDAKWTDDELLGFMAANPVLMNRPVVLTPLGAKLCRPSEEVLDILPSPQQGAFAKEDGEQVIDAAGHRVRKP